MQGPLTDKKAVADIRGAVSKGTEATVRLLNYRKDGSMFWNMLSIAPMNDADGTLRFFIGVQARVLVHVHVVLGVLGGHRQVKVAKLWLGCVNRAAQAG